ncbi:30S ribosomal protein S20 [Candidatus Curtissbacteria bacterium]|nr:30S ribosomal protein S20 [Candidatus Curtissbacteria bacterium]
MPVTKQAIKKTRADKHKTIFNLRIKKALKEAILAFGKNPTRGALKLVYRRADRAAKTNVIHKSKAARIKSRLSKKVLSRSKATKPAKPTKP